MQSDELDPEVKKRYKQLQLGVFTRKNSAFLAPLLCALNIKFEVPEGSPPVFIMACDSDTIYINPDMLTKISLKDAAYILEHELWHIARMHNARKGKRDAGLWNQACDHVINLAMQNDGTRCSIEGLADYRFDGKSEEEVYDILASEVPPQDGNALALPDDVPPDEDSGNDKGDNSSQSDSGSNPSSNPNPNYSNDLIPDLSEKKQINNLANISKAKQQAQMSNGLEPGSMAGNLKRLWEKVLSPKLPWESILRNLMKDLLPKMKLSWKRRNRRFSDIHLPSMVSGKGRLGHLVYCVDTSGSVDENQLARINSEIKYIHDHVAPKKLTVIQFDYDISQVNTFTPRDRYEGIPMQGGGGTDYDCLRRWINNLTKKPDGVIIFTDLYAKPMRPLDDDSIPVFWVAVNTKLTTVPFGEYIPVEV